MHTITDAEFDQFQRFIHREAGITLTPAKKTLVCSRLSKRLQAHALGSYGEYFRLLSSPEGTAEAQTAVDLLTTNETYFFREARHFDVLRRLAEAHRGRAQPFRVWSAACSSGEECYTIAMVLADVLGTDAAWEITGTDISMRVLKRARAGHYPLERCRHIPPPMLKRWCLRGGGPYQGTLLVDAALRRRVQFAQVNLNAELPALGPFDAVFLRNVMIYFNGDTKREVVARVLSRLKPGGHFFIGHSETLNDITDAVDGVAPSLYRKPGGGA